MPYKKIQKKVEKYRVERKDQKKTLIKQEEILREQKFLEKLLARRKNLSQDN